MDSNAHLATEDGYGSHLQAHQHHPVASSSHSTNHHLLFPEQGLHDYHDPTNASHAAGSQEAEARAVAAAAAVAAASASASASASHSSSLPAETSQLLSDSSPFSRHLGRNRACASCRDRKLKCDGMRPICGQCARAWATRKRSLKAKGVSEIELQNLEQPCSYLKAQQRDERSTSVTKGREPKAKWKVKLGESPPLEDVKLEKKRLEEEVAELKQRLQMQNHSGHNGMVENRPNSDELSIAELLATTMRSGEGFSQNESPSSTVPPLDPRHLPAFVGSLNSQQDASQIAKFASASLEAAAHIYSHPLASSHTQPDAKEPIDPLLLGSAAAYKREDRQRSGDDISQVILSSWPADFPSPATVEHLCHVFFDHCHYLRCLFQPGVFLAHLAHGPTSPLFPSHAILHAIFALAYTIRPDLDPASISLDRPHDHIQDTTLVSAKYHCERVKQHLSSLTGQGKALLSQCKAAIILANVKFGHGQMLEAWIASGIACKIASALSLNRGTADIELAGHKAKVELLSMTLLPPPQSWAEDEERRRVMFLAFATEQAGAASFLWTSGLKEADVTSQLPMYTNREFHAERIDMQPSPSQTLQSPDLFSRHRTQDTLELFLKGLILVGRCGEFLSHLPSTASVDDVRIPGWYQLNHLVSTFASTTNNAVEEHSRDPLRLVVGITIHTCTLQLHEPMARLDEQSLSICQASCTGITNTCRFLAASNIDVTTFSPMFAFGLGIAGRVLVRLLDMASNPNTSPRPMQSGLFARQTAQNFDVLHNGSVHSTSNPYPNPYAQMAGLGGPTSSSLQKVLQDDIDLIFIYLCKYGRVWPLAMRQAKAMAGQLGIKVASPELLSHGIFTDRNAGNHVYR